MALAVQADVIPGGWHSAGNESYEGFGRAVLAWESLSFLPLWKKQWEGKVLDQEQPKRSFWRSLVISPCCLILPFACINRISYVLFWTGLLLCKDTIPSVCPAGRTTLKRLIGWVKRESDTSWWSLPWSLYCQKNTCNELVMAAGNKQFSFSSSGLLKSSSTCFKNAASLRVIDLLWEGLSEWMSALQENISKLLLYEKWLDVLYSFKCMCLSVVFYFYPYIHNSSLRGGPGL